MAKVRASEHILVLNEFGLTERSRTNKSGGVKRRYTVNIRAEPIVHNLDPKVVGKGPAIAIAQFLRGRISAIAAVAAPATLRARASAQRALRRGVHDRRYTGGKLGTMEPNQTNRLFNDSGRLVKSVVVGPTGDGYTINVAGNRFDPETLDNGGSGALRRIFTQLRQYVPELGDAERLMDAIPVRRAVKEATGKVFTKLVAGALKRSGAAFEVAQQLIEISGAIADLGDALAA